MYKENEKIYFIDTISGVIREGNFIESTNDGLWLRLKGDSLNTFVYSDESMKRVFNDLLQAENSLKIIRDTLKIRLLKDNFFIKDILNRLGKSEGQLYISIVEEILIEKTSK